MTNWKLTLAYDGTPYNGWQVQPNLPTIQGTLSDAIHHVTGERVLPQGSGRTDAGVHALAQVASCSLTAPIPPANLHRALNRCLPPSIRILTAEPALTTFHARHSALRKTYEYRIFPLHPDRICPPTLAPYVWPCPWPLDLAALNQAGRHILGTHDFTTFAATDPDQTTRASPISQDSENPAKSTEPPLLGNPRLQPWASTSREEQGALAPGACSPSEPPPLTRTIYHSQWHAHDDLLLYTVTGSGFLHHMVRNLVGTFVQSGAHRLDPETIPTLLAARNRSASGPTAPASGLFLVNVIYPGSPLITHNSQLPL
jgi:tRNA pseudouridine38-40 synthase